MLDVIKNQNRRGTCFFRTSFFASFECHPGNCEVVWSDIKAKKNNLKEEEEKNQSHTNW